MSTTTSGAAESHTFGNWILMRAPGIAGLSLLGSVIAIAGLVMAMFTLLFLDLAAALVVLAVSAVAFTMAGTPLGYRLVRRVGFTRAKWAGEHQYRSGVFSTGPQGSGRLPGMLGKTTLIAKTDALGQATFGVIKSPKRGGMYTIVARCVPDGPYMEDQSRLNTWVGNMSTVLSALGQESALVGAKAITDTAPDPGDRLAAGVAAMSDPDAPQLAKDVMAECVATYPDTSSENVTYLELTFLGRSLNRKGDEASILAELARRVPGLLQQLSAAGGGAVDMVSAAELPEIVHVAYDPAAQRYIEQARISQLNGGHGSQISWAEAGPVATQEKWDRLLHDSGTSVTWEMYSAPRSTVTELAIGALVSPHRDFTRKRVALIYRPQGPDKSVNVSETDANQARFASGRKKRIAAVDDLRMKATDKSRAEVAAGAVMVRFSLLVTITVTRAEDLDQAEATLHQIAGAVPIRLRRSSGSQAAGFAATLPAGFVPWEHTVVPDQVREWM